METDLRVQRTRAAIREALVSLAQEGLGAVTARVAAEAIELEGADAFAGDLA